ncbi:MAG: iron-siderophore ABC transporter substrate-binding protein [Hapalosiphonaceae cyanobacterium JJU2]|nr:MAG: iron-siderophore ABC transporter substrate-binding protein [Hapalosiphonaceae cyanobacterium JJU2]
MFGACYDCFSHISLNKYNQTLSISQSPITTRIFKHSLGKTVIPTKPQRIIALDDSVILDPLLALGIKPIGATSYWQEKDIKFRGLSADQSTDIELVGSINQPSLEKILMLKPDLILAREGNITLYNLLAKIAPTVIVDRSKFEDSFKDNFRFVAQVLGKEEKARQVLEQYQKRVAELQKQIKEQLKKIKVSVIGYNYFGKDLFFVSNLTVVHNQVLTDVGIRHLPIIDNQKDYSLTLSIEAIYKYDADIIFVINYAKTPLSHYLQHPLWASLKAVKNKRVYEVKPDVWATFGPLGANRILDDLFKYLVNKP